jgi:hypothetical protein
MNINIISKRAINKHQVYDLVYEWEDDLASGFNAKIIKRPAYFFCYRIFSVPIKVINKILNKTISFDFLTTLMDDIWLKLFDTDTDRIYLRIDIFPVKEKYFQLARAKKKVIPWIIDFDKSVDIKNLENVYNEYLFVMVSSKNAVDYLKKNNCSLKIKYFPLFLPKKRAFIKGQFLNDKRYDLILPGRPNKTILKWLKVFSKEHSLFEYFTYSDIDNRNVYISNKGGVVPCKSRKQYLSLLKKCKIGIYSTQGVDGSIVSLDHITIKLFELISCGCLVIGKYPETEDSKSMLLTGIISKADSYTDFSMTLKKFLNFKYKSEDEFNRLILDYQLITKNNRVEKNIIMLNAYLKKNGGS